MRQTYDLGPKQVQEAIVDYMHRIEGVEVPETEVSIKYQVSAGGMGEPTTVLGDLVHVSMRWGEPR